MPSLLSVNTCCLHFTALRCSYPQSIREIEVQNSQNIKYNGTIQGLKYIWRTEGFRVLFKGNGTNYARIVPNSAVKFFSYEQASKGILYLYQQQTGNGCEPKYFTDGVSVASGNFLAAKRRGVVEGIDYGSTGEVKKVDVSRIQLLGKIFVQSGNNIKLC
ncbi:uncharacterized protein LOC131011203 [Salvia miltiorrhiza]|uniref:uncharacterized protein LOC131011203 n=1 Tax=Salvia miltiorrhiza TaxID=226208 RepID=UPI0025ACD0C4|nr:uncharacterized protein LOC131011203 [Salvia miltiorrhiza]